MDQARPAMPLMTNDQSALPMTTKPRRAAAVPPLITLTMKTRMNTPKRGLAIE
jgi:hypothetical protein